MLIISARSSYISDNECASGSGKTSLPMPQAKCTPCARKSGMSCSTTVRLTSSGLHNSHTGGKVGKLPTGNGLHATDINTVTLRRRHRGEAKRMSGKHGCVCLAPHDLDHHFSHLLPISGSYSVTKRCLTCSSGGDMAQAMQPRNYSDVPSTIYISTMPSVAYLLVEYHSHYYVLLHSAPVNFAFKIQYLSFCSFLLFAALGCEGQTYQRGVVSYR
jgi:hypothetical protein